MSKVSAAVRAALSKPGSFATDRGVEVERRGGYKEILVSFRGLKTILEGEGEETKAPAIAAPVGNENQEPDGDKKEDGSDSGVVTPPDAPAPEEKKEEAPAPVAAPAPAPAAPVKAKPGPKPKAPAAA